MSSLLQERTQFTEKLKEAWNIPHHLTHNNAVRHMLYRSESLREEIMEVVEAAKILLMMNRQKIKITRVTT